MGQRTETEERLKLLLLPKDPNDDKNIVLEIRGGTGGEEARHLELCCVGAPVIHRAVVPRIDVPAEEDKPIVADAWKVACHDRQVDPGEERLGVHADMHRAFSQERQELIAVLTRDPASETYSEIAGRLGTSEGNIRVAVHRLRCRYGLLLREEIAATVGDATQVEDEIRTLFAALEG